MSDSTQSQPGVWLKRDGLLPCPFCGGEVCRDYVNDSYTEDISCGNCGMSFRISNEDWNTRAESAAPGENLELAELKRDKERLDCCDAHRWCVIFNGRIHAWTVMAYDQVVGCIGKGRTMREAIDDTITKAKTEGAK